MSSLRTTARPLPNLVQGRPVLAIFEVCLRCNSACGYCNLPLNVGRYEMTREEIWRVFSDLYRNGLRLIFVQGGEPLLRRDLGEILEDLGELGFSLTLITNGTRFTRELVTRLARLPLNISVSLDTLDRERYRRISGADQLSQVLDGIDLLEGFPHQKYLTCIVSELNREDVVDVVRFARERGFIPVVGAYHWGIERYGKVDASLQYDRRAVAQIFEQVITSGLVPCGYFENYLRDNLRWLNGGSLERCDAGRYSIAIDASGNVAPCLALNHAGNLLESSLEEILDRLDHDAIRRCSDRSSCNMVPEAGMRRFLLGQARQESYHAVVFQGATAWLAQRHLGLCPMLQPLERYRALVEEAIHQGNFAETLLAEQIILEGLGEAILKRIEAGLITRNAPFGRLRRILLHQEEAHHSFGHRALARAIASGQTSPDALRSRGQEYLGLTDAMVTTLSDLFESIDEDPSAWASDAKSYVPAWLIASG